MAYADEYNVIIHLNTRQRMIIDAVIYPSQRGHVFGVWKEEKRMNKTLIYLSFFFARR